MAGKEQVSVAVRDDFVARQTRAKPVPALAELIWNALDADATRVTVELSYEDLAGGLSRILVNDNGSGIRRDQAATLFGNLGGSWKRTTRETPEGHRRIHGQEGRGRYKAFALGKAVTWTVVQDRARRRAGGRLEGSVARQRRQPVARPVPRDREGRRRSQVAPGPRAEERRRREKLVLAQQRGDPLAQDGV